MRPAAGRVAGMAREGLFAAHWFALLAKGSAGASRWEVPGPRRITGGMVAFGCVRALTEATRTRRERLNSTKECFVVLDVVELGLPTGEQ